MRRLGRLGAAIPVGAALLLLAACAHAVPVPTSPPVQSVAPISAPANTGSTVPSPTSTTGEAGASSDQLNQIDNQIGDQLTQIDNDMGQVNQGLATSEGDPAQ